MTLAASVALAASIGAAPGRARAETPDKARCADAYEAAQRLERAGKIDAALAEATLCSSSSCPEVLRADCTRWIGPLRARQSSFVVEARDAQGADLSDVRVSVDGVVVRERLDGLAIHVDPGPHTLVLEGPRREERTVVAREGDLGRRLVVTFGAVETAAEPSPESRRPLLPTATWIFGGVGVAGLGTFTVLGLSGRALEGELDRTCAPACADARVARVDTSYLVADIGLGVGIASLIVATYFALAR